MGDGSGDSQKIWHEFVGSMFSGKTILDVGAGLGLSKERLSNGGRNEVTTQDTNRARMAVVDYIAYIDDLFGMWDVVTAFDVVEHTVYPQYFLGALYGLAKETMFITSPNKYVVPRPWHWKPTELVGMVKTIVGDSPISVFGRFKTPCEDYIILLKDWDSPNQQAFQIGVRIDKLLNNNVPESEGVLSCS